MKKQKSTITNIKETKQAGTENKEKLIKTP